MKFLLIAAILPVLVKSTLEANVTRRNDSVGVAEHNHVRQAPKPAKNETVDHNQRGYNSLTKQKIFKASSEINLHTINASFDELYSEVVSQNTVWSFIFPGAAFEVRSRIQNMAVMVHVSAADAEENFPVLFVVEEQRGILSWQVPLILQNEFSRFFYEKVSRVLCPFGNLVNHHIVLQVSTFSQTPTNFTVLAELVVLDLKEWANTTITPSQPRFFRYTFPPDVNSVVVKAESEDDVCMVFSVQEVMCPVMDQVRNVEFTGMHQTVTRKGAITVQRTQFKNATFFVVVVATVSDFECRLIELIAPGMGVAPNGTGERKKEVYLSVTSSISSSEYLIAILAAFGWFLGFYVMTFIIAIIYHCIEHSRCGRRKSEEFPREEANSPLAAESGCTTSYGSLEGASVPSTSSDNGSDGVRQRGFNTNPISHVPPPDDRSSTSSLDESEIDMLHDVYQDKNIFRMKTYLYVADLARKSRKSMSKKFKLYPWNLIVLAVFYALPVIQLVITYQKVLNRTGNQDSCYYNFYCAHPLHPFTAFNNVISNIGYALLGLLFLVLVYRRDVMHRRLMRTDPRMDKTYGIPQHFGLFYTLGIALLMEGVLSACYHVCPSYNNFQFDTSFMYVMAWLLMLKIYQTRHPDINPNAHIAYFILAFVILFVVIGVMYGTYLFWVVFGVVYVTFYLILSTHVYYMGRWKIDRGVLKRLYLLLRMELCRCTRPMYFDRLILLLFGNAVNLSFAVYGIVETPRDFASYLLSIFIVNLLMYFAFYIIMKVRSGERLLPLPVIYTLSAAVVWSFAFYFFLLNITSWQLTPSQSREHNHSCVFLNFYDSHDIWHFLSAMGLFLSFMMLLTLDDDLIHTPRDKIRVF